MSIGPLEIAVIIVLALIILGPKRLPQAGRSLGQAVRELKKATAAARADLGIDEVAADVKDLKQDLKTSVGLDDVAADVKDIKAGMTINLKDAEKPAAGPAVGAPGAAGTAAVEQLTEPETASETPDAESAAPDEAAPEAPDAQPATLDESPPVATVEPEAAPETGIGASSSIAAGLSDTSAPADDVAAPDAALASDAPPSLAPEPAPPSNV